MQTFIALDTLETKSIASTYDSKSIESGAVTTDPHAIKMKLCPKICSKNHSR